MNLTINRPKLNDLLRQCGIALANQVISKYGERPAISSFAQISVPEDLFRLDVGTFGRSHEIVGTLVSNQSKSLLTNVIVGGGGADTLYLARLVT